MVGLIEKNAEIANSYGRVNLILRYQSQFYQQELKNICWGSASSSPSQGWLRGLKFNQPEEPTAYGLKLAADAPKPFLMCLQVEFESYRNNQRNVTF